MPPSLPPPHLPWKIQEQKSFPACIIMHAEPEQETFTICYIIHFPLSITMVTCCVTIFSVISTLLYKEEK